MSETSHVKPSVLLTNIFLGGRTGSELHTLTLAKAFAAKWVFAARVLPRLGRLADNGVVWNFGHLHEMAKKRIGFAEYGIQVGFRSKDGVSNINWGKRSPQAREQ